MAALPEWMSVSSVDLSESEKKILLGICQWLKLECTCTAVDQCGTKSQFYCCLCNDIVNSPEPKIFIHDTHFVNVRRLLSLNVFKLFKLKMVARLLF